MDLNRTRERCLCAIVASCLVAFGVCLASPVQAASSHESAAAAAESLEGDWLSQTTGTLYSFVQTGADSYSGRVPGAACVDQPGDIKDTAEGKGLYKGTENTWSSFDPALLPGRPRTLFRFLPMVRRLGGIRPVAPIAGRRRGLG